VSIVNQEEIGSIYTRHAQNIVDLFRVLNYSKDVIKQLQFYFGSVSHSYIFGPRRDEVTGEWRRLHNEELNDLYSSPNIVRVIKSRRMRWAGHVARMGEEKGCIGAWGGNRRERDPVPII
jgi:hypothetical protein